MRTKAGKKTITIDPNQASQIVVRPLDPPAPVQAVEALVEAKQGSKVLATVVKRAELAGAPTTRRVAVCIGPNIVIVPDPRPMPMTPGSQGPNEDGQVKIGGALSVDGVPRGSGKAIRPPTVDMGEARIGSSASPDRPTENAGTPLVRTPESTIHDVAVGGAGRYLILTLKTARKLIVFDVNAAEFVKTITLPSESSLVIAGA